MNTFFNQEDLAALKIQLHWKIFNLRQKSNFQKDDSSEIIIYYS
jgi:hypothetical protein